MTRLITFDFLRGIAIIMVICIHSIIYDKTNGNFLYIGIIFRNILNVAVPLFLAISGYFMAEKQIENKKQYTSFLYKQVPRVYLPMLVWSLLYLIMAILHDENPVKSLIKWVIGGYSIYYFIILIVQYYFLLPVLQKWGSSGKGVILTIFISLFSILCLETVFYIFNQQIPLIVYAGPFPLWIMFYVIGIYLRKHPQAFSYNIKYMLLSVVIFYILSIAENFVIMHYTHQIKGLGIKFFSFCYAFTFIILLFSDCFKQFIEKKKNNTILLFIAKIGEYSFGIYLIHVFIIIGLNKIIGYQDFNWLLVLIISIIIVATGKKLIPSFSRKYLGF